MKGGGIKRKAKKSQNEKLAQSEKIRQSEENTKK